MVNRVLWQYYVLAVLLTLGPSFSMAMYANYLRQHGLDLFQANLVNVVFFTTLLIFEIPTGIFADIWGRKVSYIVACLLSALGAIVYGFSSQMWQFMVAEFILAFALTFASGAFNAWFIDRLRHHGYEGRLDRIFARKQLLSAIASIIGIFVGAQVADYWLSGPWFLGGIFFLINAIVACSIKEEYFTRSTIDIRARYKALAIGSIKHALNQSTLRFIFVLTCVQTISVQALNMQWIPFFDPDVNSQSWLGWIGVMIMAVIGVGGLIGPKIRDRFGSEYSAMITCQIGIGMAIITTAIIGNSNVGLLVFLIHEVGRGIFVPLRTQYIHHHATTDDRATMESIQSIAHHAGGMVGLLISGLFAVQFGITATWIISGVFLIGSSVIIAIRHRSLNK